jgi:MFS family permease
MLLIARFLQGTSGAMINATQIAIITSVVSPRERGKYIGMITAAVYVGLSAGPFLGGLVIDQVGWRAAFVMHLPLAVVVLLIGLFGVKDEWQVENPTRFDRLGALLWTSSIAIFCVGVSLLPSLIAFALIVLSWGLLYLFLRHARQSEQPLWDVKLFFQNRVFTLSATASLLMYAATYANVVLLSLYLQSIKALTASQAGLIMMVQPAMMAIFSPIMGRLSDRVEPRMLASAGMVITATGLFILAQLHTDSGIAQVVIALLLTGGGFSLFSSPNINAIMGSVTPKHYGSASGAVATTRIMGQLSSMVLVTLSISLVMGDVAVSAETRDLLANAIDLSFTIAGCLCLLGILFSVFRGRIHTEA